MKWEKIGVSQQKYNSTLSKVDSCFLEDLCIFWRALWHDVMYLFNDQPINETGLKCL